MGRSVAPAAYRPLAPRFQQGANLGAPAGVVRDMLPKLLIALVAALALAPAASAAPSDPERVWTFTEIRKGQTDVLGETGTQVGGRLDRTHAFGSAVFEFLRPGDAGATGEITSTASGKTFDVYAQSPSGRAHGAVIGGKSQLVQSQSFRKRRGKASMTFQITRAIVSAIDANGSSLLPSECPPRLECQPVRGDLRFEARAYVERTGREFFRTGGVAYVHGHQGRWDIDAAAFGDSPRALWARDNFFADPDADGTGTGSHALLELLDKRTVRIPLRSVKRRRRFAVQITLRADVVDNRGRESMVEGFLRDPRRAGALIRTRGVKRLGAPVSDAPPKLPLPAAQCPQGADPASGSLQLSAPSYAAYESDAGGPFVLVTRTAGSTGAASATVTTTAGSAEAGTDYAETSTTVRFRDGDTSPRLVEIPIVGDELAEDDETLSVALTDVACAQPGAQATADVTIVDDDSDPEPGPSFTVGGTVTGLEGSGLTLANLGQPLAITANGPFAFSPPVADGIPYEVSVAEQPSNPDQVCSVADGDGTVAGADVTDIAVTCTTPPPISGLDPAFGDGGKLSTPGGRGQAVAIQDDGMIVTAGGNLDFVVTRTTPDGDPDPNWGDNGSVTTDLGGIDEAFDVAVDDQDRIVAVGSSDHPDRDIAVVRYEPDGDPDPNFGGGDGIVLTDFNHLADAANGVVIQPDGKIVVAGHAQPVAFQQNDIAVVRYEENGDVDLKVTTDLGTSTDLGNAVALDAQDRIVVAGQVEQGDDIALVRYEPDGDVDLNVTTDLGGGDMATGVKIAADGDILLAGSSSRDSGHFDILLARYGADGTLESSTTTDLSGDDDFGADLAIDEDGRIVVVGQAASSTFSDLALVRYSADGVLDEDFDPIVADFHGAGDQGKDVAIDADGRIVVAGLTANGLATEFALMRALP